MNTPPRPDPGRTELESTLREREAQLRRESERLVLALDATRASIWDYDVAAGAVSFDAGWLDMLGGGAAPHRAGIREAFRWVHPEERAASFAKVQACLSGRLDTCDMEHRVRHADGSWIWVHSRGRVTARTPGGRALRMIGTNIDITRRKTAEIATARDATFLASLTQLTISLLQRRARTDVLIDLAEKAVPLFGEHAQVEVALVEGEELVVHACGGQHCDAVRKRVRRSESPRAWRAMDTRLPVTAGATPEPDETGSPTAFFPILLDPRPLGVLAITRPPPEPPFTRDELGKGRLLAQLAALVIHNAGIYEDAVHLAETRAADVADREERYRQIVENINQGFYTANARSLFTYCNPAISLVTGLPPDELVGTSSFRLVAAPDRARIIALYRTWSAGTERHVTAEFRVDKPGGGQIWVEQLTQIIRHPDGRVAEFRNFLRDITERKAAAEALRESELRFRTLADVAPVGIFSTDAAGRMAFVNRRWCEIAGLDSEQAAGDRWLQAVHPEDRAAVTEGWTRAVQTGSSNSVRFRFLRANGEITYLVGHSRPHLDGSGRITGHVGTITDITSLHLAEESRRKTELQLRQAQKMESLGTLAGGIAHDFNNILTGILGYAQLARLDMPENHPSARWLENLAAAGHRAKGLVQQILTFSRKKDGQIAPMPLQPVLKDAFGLLRSTVPAMIELRQDIDEGCPPVMADGTQIHQIVMNLCTNALHALPPERGWIELKLQLRELAHDFDTATVILPSGRYAVLSVGDNGHGMTPEVLERIFEPFFTTKDSGKGTGLGLAVVHGIVQAHGGGVSVRSAPGLGTRFEIFLPALQPAATDASHSRAPLALPRGRSQRVLFVDDDTLAGPAISRLVRSLGYLVTEFDDPRQALHHFESVPESFDLVLTDLAMPDLPGDQFAARVLALRPDLPVILISGYLEPGRQTTLQQAGIQAILEKPPTLDALATTLARFLPA